MVVGKLVAERSVSIEMFYIHFLQIRVLWQYFSDVWEQVWESPLHFRAKETRRRREEEERLAEEQDAESEEDVIMNRDQAEISDDDAMEIDDSDSEADEAPIRRRRRSRLVQPVRRGVRQRKMKGLPKDFEDPPGLDFKSVRAQLGEKPVNRAQGPLANRLIELVFSDLFYDRPLVMPPNWKKLKYLKGYQKIRERLLREAPELADEFVNGLFRLFTYYCTCIPAYSLARWISPRKVEHQNKAAWLSFMKRQRPREITSYPGSDSKGYSDDSWWWPARQSITDDFCWGLSARDAVSAEVLSTVRRREHQLETDNNILPADDSKERRELYRFYSRWT